MGQLVYRLMTRPLFPVRVHQTSQDHVTEGFSHMILASLARRTGKRGLVISPLTTVMSLMNNLDVWMTSVNTTLHSTTQQIQLQVRAEGDFLHLPLW
jgi:hypothetical protein